MYQMMSFLSSVSLQLVVVCLLVIKSSSQMRVIPDRYYIPLPNTYKGGMLTIDCNLGDTGDLHACPITTRLTDNITGEGQQFKDNEFVGWNNSFRIVIQTTSPGIISQVNIYFYNNPSIGYGLAPIITAGYGFDSPLMGFAPIQTSFLENCDLSQNNDIVTNVSLILTNEDDLPYEYLELSFNLSSAKINQVFLSEIQVFDGTDTTLNESAIMFLISNQSLQYGSNNVTSSVKLSCTVINEGSFTYTWMGPNGVIIANTDRTQLFLADTSRTSILIISRLNLSDSGNYTCMSSYRHSDLEDVPSKTATVSLTLEGSVTHPESVEVSLLDDVALECNFTGYLPFPSVVTWRDEDGSELFNTDGYNISTDLNGSGNSQRGGDGLENGVRSILSISLVMDSDLGGYVCEMDGTNIQGTIRLTTADTSSTSSSTPSSISSSTSSSTPSSISSSPTPISEGTSSQVAIIAGSVIGGLLFLLILLTITVILAVVIGKKRMSKTSSYSMGDPLYSEVSKPSLPPLPTRLINSGYADIDIPDSGFPLVEITRTSPGSFSPQDDSPKPAQLRERPDFLKPNPMYASAEHIDKSLTGNNLRPTASLPFLDMTEEPHVSSSMFNIYAPTSSVAPPIPEYRGTPDPMGSIYSEDDINPSMFSGGVTSENDDIYHMYSSVYANPQPLQRSDQLLEVKEKNVLKIRDLGMGQFGEVELAHTVGLSLKQLRMSESNDDTGVSLVIAVKRLRSEADETMREAFEKEIKFMARLHHENVVRLLGVCLNQNAFIMMEYMIEGDLNHYLKMRKLVSVESYPLPENTVNVPVLLYISLQVASGMRYLASLKYIHRDLATRNILVGQDFKVKIADFGMSQRLYSSFYYRIKGKAVLPIRWMSSECFYGRFSEKSDAWAFGVTMWEIFTLCQQQPYEHISDQEVVSDALKGKDRTLLSQPPSCPDEVYHVMMRCWVYEPDERATFEEVHGLLSQIHAYNDYH